MEPQSEASLDRRRLLRGSAAGAGVLASAVAAPSISGIGTVPAFAQCMSMGVVPTVDVECNSQPVSCFDTLTASLELSDFLTTSNTSISDRAVDAFTGLTFPLTGSIATNIPAICPGDFITWTPAITIDLCELFNDLLAVAPDALPNTATLAGFEAQLVNINIDSISLPNFAQDSISPVAPCPEQYFVGNNQQTASWAPEEPIYDGCVWTCPAPATEYSRNVFGFSARLEVEVLGDVQGNVVFGGFSAAIMGNLSAGDCVPDFNAAFTCVFP